MRWGVPQVLDALNSLPHKVALALDKVVEKRCVSLFLAQFTIEGAPTMLHLEALSNFTAISWGIQVHERNESESSNKEQMKNHEAHITKTL